MIDVVFENSHFLICDKPGGVLSVPAREQNDARPCLGTTLQKTLGIQIFPIHRLDFEVSGLVMYAKTAEAHREANHWFENKLVQKTYRALTTGQDFAHIPANIPNPRMKIALKEGSSFEWKARILRGKKRTFESPHGKDSVTLATYLGLREDGIHAWDVSPITGRSHQLRFDLSRNGFPIVGDALYGSTKTWYKPKSIALRSFEVKFTNVNRAEALDLPPKISISSL